MIIFLKWGLKKNRLKNQILETVHGEYMRLLIVNYFFFHFVIIEILPDLVDYL